MSRLRRNRKSQKPEVELQATMLGNGNGHPEPCELTLADGAALHFFIEINQYYFSLETTIIFHHKFYILGCEKQ